jgi:hypothetical protein
MLFIASPLLRAPVKRLCSASSRLRRVVERPPAHMTDGSEYVIAAVGVALLVAMTKRPNTIQTKWLTDLTLTAQGLMTASSVVYLLVGGTLAYEQFLMGLSLTYMFMFASIFLTGD